MPLTWNLPPHPHLVVSDRPRSTPLPHPLLTSTLTLPTYRKWSSRWDRTPWCYRRLSRGRRWSLICIRLRLAVWGRNGINSGKGWGPTKGNKFFIIFFYVLLDILKIFCIRESEKPLARDYESYFSQNSLFFLWCIFSASVKQINSLKLERFLNFFLGGGEGSFAFCLFTVCALFLVFRVKLYQTMSFYRCMRLGQSKCPPSIWRPPLRLAEPPPPPRTTHPTPPQTGKYSLCKSECRSQISL